MPQAARATAAPSNGAATALAVVDPYRAYNFKLQIGSDTAGHFTYVSGIGARIEAISFREAGQHQLVHRLPGRVEYADVELRYGLTSSRILYDWFLTGVSGSVVRKEVSIIMLDSKGDREVMRWNLKGAWVKEWRAAALDALANEVAIESMVLVFEEMELVLGQPAA